MDSPVSQRTPDECNAIKSWGFGHSKLTSVGSFETGFGTFHKAVSGPRESAAARQTRSSRRPPRMRN